MWIELLMVTVTVTVVSCSPCNTSINRAAMTDLYNGAVWTSAQWNESADVMSWPGVFCSGGTITRISLMGVQLSGTLPSSLSALAMLTSVDLDGNSFQGTLPSSWSNWTSIQSIKISKNKLSGALPASWSAMLNLTDVDLGSNKINGTLPDSWSSMTNIVTLKLSSNNLSGTLPASWSAMALLTDFELSSNQISGALPDAWSSMTLLLTLFLNVNKLTGALPASWSDMTMLTDVDLSSNEISGTLPDAWSSMTNLETLLLNNNKLTGTLPASWNAMSMTILSLADNSIMGALPPSWGALAQLVQLKLANNKISGALPNEWAGLAMVTNLDCSYNQLSGTLPGGWSSLPSLAILSLQFNNLNGPLPVSWAILSNVTSLNLESNMITGTLPHEWSALTALSTLLLGENQLSGTLPSSWANMSRLGDLDLSSNSLAGTLPADWNALTSLLKVNLSNNRLDGTLPKEWRALHLLSKLNLSQNKLGGSLPSEWADLIRLTTITLEGNELSGTIPLAIAELPLLSFVNLTSNNFSGIVPSSWLTCRSMNASIDLQNNHFANTPINLSAAQSLLSNNCSQTSINLCGNKGVFNASTIRSVRGQALWQGLNKKVFPRNCSLEGIVSGSSTLTMSLTESSRSLLSETHSSSVTIQTMTLQASDDVSATVSPSCPERHSILSNVTLQPIASSSRTSERPPLITSTGRQVIWLQPIPVLSFAAVILSRQALVLQLDPAVGVLLQVPDVGNMSASMGRILSAVVEEAVDGGRIGIVIVFAKSALGTLSLVASSVLEVNLELGATGRCIEAGYREQMSLRWPIAAGQSQSALVAVTMTAFRSSSVASALLGHPLNAMTTTGLVSLMSLDECMFSDVDPLDSSVSPFTGAAIGPDVGQYYRGAAVVALCLYGITCMLALGGAMLMRCRSRLSSSRLEPYLAKLHFPSVGVILVGIFGQGLATCGVSLIRLDDSAGDTALGIASLLVCVLCVAFAAMITTAWLQVRIVKQKLQRSRRSWFGRYLAYSVWQDHWRDTSGSLQFKRRYMMLIDDLRLPWWTAVEMCSSCLQGTVLGLRISSVEVCRAQMCALAAHCMLLLCLAIYFRPCGAVLSNVFLVLSKLGTCIISALVLLHAITLEQRFAQSAQAVTSISTAIATFQSVLQIVTALLLGLPSDFLRALRRIIGRSHAESDKDEKDSMDDEHDMACGVLHSFAATDRETYLREPARPEGDEGPAKRWHSCWMDQEVIGQAMLKREVMKQLIDAVDPATRHHERLSHLISAAAITRSTCFVGVQ